VPGSEAAAAEAAAASCHRGPHHLRGTAWPLQTLETRLLPPLPARSLTQAAGPGCKRLRRSSDVPPEAWLQGDRNELLSARTAT